MIRILASACVILMGSGSLSHALECETDPAKFAFTSDTPSTFNMGEKRDVDRAYAALAGALGPLDSYPKTRIFYSKGYEGVRDYDCKDEKCRAMEVLEGLQQCGAGGMSKKDACYPLAVVYQQKLYCLLYPGQPDFDPSKPFVPYVPFKNSQDGQ
ncbi:MULTISPECIES: hypothetical protein [Rhizobium/Agrobacterium group]|uniref:Uncharacterized protein n=1 Tax=Agrobacterium tumefaciens TaxID=358 RepID=A0A546XMJ8_AGRTU|nr:MULTISPECIES: hypothetical protein [Rhizobium/Agrobacterium group]MBO0128824.1 hypothetical protein [Agrobacterium sp. OT33]NSX92064.1 hypothetical protein [Agrobacterium tumefaciens]NTE57942.1 hypothetical protein [Agrobacterium tumefaciens]NTE58023.1 hypothetical protein [Agrobacterium tumefaciens]NTE74745.1 hypothetical protein [Agrobacterium tumefaciens]